MDISQFPQCQRHEWIFYLDTLFHSHCLACEDELGKHENWHCGVSASYKATPESKRDFSVSQPR